MSPGSLPVIVPSRMTEPKPVACSLEARDLRQRLADIAALGNEGLVGREVAGGTHLLRFRGDPEIRSRLAAIVAAEAECCSFLQLDLEEEGGELVLTIAAPGDGQAVAAELAAAF
jgi:hypothetical protein